MNEKLDPINFKITNVENRKNGTLFIESKKCAKKGKKLKKQLKLILVKNMKLKYKMNFKMQKKELMEKLKN